MVGIGMSDMFFCVFDGIIQNDIISSFLFNPKEEESTGAVCCVMAWKIAFFVKEPKRMNYSSPPCVCVFFCILT